MEKLYYRDIIEDIWQQMPNRDIIILIGSRQVGKTSILKLLSSKLNENRENRIYFFDGEIPDHMEIFSTYNNFLAYFKTQTSPNCNRRIYIFLDEFHKIPQINKVLKIIHDHHEYIKIIASGSSSLEMQKRVKESLAGRKKIIKIYPLSFREFLRFKREDELLNIFDELSSESSSIPFHRRFIDVFNEYCIWGGYPKVVLTDGDTNKVLELEDIYRSYILKDIKGFLREENIIAFNKLVKYLSVQIGCLLNIHQLCQKLGVARPTLERYIFLLENTFIITKISPYYTNKLKEISKMPKIYFYDMGLRNYSISNFNPLSYRADGGFILENAVLAEILKKDVKLININFWQAKSGQEIDFVLTKGERVVLLETKLSSRKQPLHIFSLFKKRVRDSTPYFLTDSLPSKVKGTRVIPYYLTTKIM